MEITTHSTAASPGSHSGKRAAYLNLLFTLLIWLLIASLHALASYKDALRNTLRNSANAKASFDYIAILPGYALLAIISYGFYIAFSRKTESMLKTRNILMSTCMIVILGLPVLTGLVLFMETTFSHPDAMSMKAGFDQRSGFAFFTDAVLLLFAYLMQVAYAFGLKGQAENLAYAQQSNESLALRLRLLQGQLKPHFLFNALNSISALVRTADRELASSALEKLSALLRYVVHSGKHEWLSVADEIAFTKAYLDMQMLRYGERTSISWNMPDEAWQDLACPPLLFQPLVENAIHHGVEQNHEICHLQIGLAKKGDLLEFRITNPLFKQTSSKKGHGLGISASRDRLAILYGQQAALRTDVTTDSYTAILEFPAMHLKHA
ncbi:sensor histidine kinase [Undibacterium pigrum]|uniref:Histidine kinase n=1 Tax=Undibacterium pigrum TaxID=401470 RepID=A0A318J7W3_9BURK|nr:histidine kinase [Undibacterium pigrum]PXX43233.1 histidine kinase [Undibacterium pigrum]